HARGASGGFGRQPARPAARGRRRFSGARVRRPVLRRGASRDRSPGAPRVLGRHAHRARWARRRRPAGGRGGGREGTRMTRRAWWIVAAALAVAARPRLWVTAVRQVVVLARPGWWRRPPFLPMPSRDYLRFRLLTAYGDATRSPE